MKSLILTTLFIASVASANAHANISRIECSGAPRSVSFSLEFNHNTESFHGSGIENFAEFNLDCKKIQSHTIVCKESEARGRRSVSAVITIDQDNIVSANFNGIYNNHRHVKLGCIAGM